MDQEDPTGRSLSTADLDSQQHSPYLNQGRPSSTSHDAAGSEDPASVGLGLDLDLESSQQNSMTFPATANPTFDTFTSHSDFLSPRQSTAQQAFNQNSVSDPTVFDPSSTVNFGQHSSSGTGADCISSFDAHSQPTFLSPNFNENFNDGDFSLFPPNNQTDQFSTPLFEQSSLGPNDMDSMTSPRSHPVPSPPNMLQPDALRSGSGHQSPSFAQSHQFPPPQVTRQRNVSLGPEAALLPGQVGDWTQAHFQGHRRAPSEYSDVSSVSPSPHLAGADGFDDHVGHSPLQRASDGSLYQDLLNIESFNISDPGQPGRSPSLSPAISPRIMPQQMPDMHRPSLGSAPPNLDFASLGAFPGMPNSAHAFPDLSAAQLLDRQLLDRNDFSPMAPPPAINIDFAPNNAKQGSYELSKAQIDQDSLTPPERGRLKSRPRSVTDPFHPGSASLGRPQQQSSRLSPSPDFSTRTDSSRSLSPLDRAAASSPSRRRQSTSAVPNNVIALRLADPEYQGSQDSGAVKRVQKHPATFQCTLCPKRFTRAYNLRSHLRTHTDERPFVCNVCGKAFARQHDRKRHESLHSGEKRFVCKGDLKASGQWGCGRRFARADALGRHFRSEAGRICIKPLLDEEMMERQRQWQEQSMQQQNMPQNVSGGPHAMALDPSNGYPVDANGNYALPAALLQQYPALAQMNWSAQDAAGGMEDDISGRSSFDASDYDEADDGGYVSGSGSMNQSFGEMGYTSDFGGG